jgi:hypothetical protein
MKLQQLFETIDQRNLLRELAKELGYSDPALYQIWEEHDINKDVKVALELFHVHMDTEGSISLYDRLSALETWKEQETHAIQDAFEAFEGTSFEELEGVKEMKEAMQLMKASHAHMIESVKNMKKIYQLLSAFNNIAVGSDPRQNQDEGDAKYRATICRAGLKKLGITARRIGD